MTNNDVLCDNQFLFVVRFQLGDRKIILLKDKETNELYLNLSDMATLLYYNNEIEMLSKDDVLDILNTIKKETGRFLIQDNLGSSRLLQKIPINDKQ